MLDLLHEVIRVIHGGRSFDLVFDLDEGFGIKTDALPFSHIPIWSEANTKPHQIGSLKSASCHVIKTTLDAFDQFTDLLIKTVTWPRVSSVVPCRLPEEFPRWVHPSRAQSRDDLRSGSLPAWCEASENADCG
jgi:hypothetical protein